MTDSLPTKSPRIDWLRRNGAIVVCVLAGLAAGYASVAVSGSVNPFVLLAAAIALLIGVWFLRGVNRVLFALVAVIAVLPRFALPTRLAGFTPTLLDLALIGVLLVWRLHANKEVSPVPRLPITVPLICLMVVAVATFIVGLPNGALTPLVLRRFVEMLLSFGMVWVLAALLQQRSDQNRLVRWMLLLGGLSAFIGVVLYFIPDELTMRALSALRIFGYPEGPGVLRYVRDDPAQLQRATGLWIDPNAFGGYLLIIGALGLPQLFARQPVMRRGWVFVCLSAITLALVLTISRGAMLGLAIVAVLMGLLKYRRLLPLIALVLVVALVLPQTRDLIAHFADGFAGRDLATQMRFGEYKDALRLIERYPLLGVGFIDTPDVDLYIGVSSMYLLVAQQMGLLGVSAFALVLLVLFISAIHRWPQIRDDDVGSAIWLGAHGAVLGALFSGIFDHYFFNIDFHTSVMLLWMMIALAQVSGTKPVRPSN